MDVLSVTMIYSKITIIEIFSGQTTDLCEEQTQNWLQFSSILMKIFND